MGFARSSVLTALGPDLEMMVILALGQECLKTGYFTKFRVFTEMSEVAC